MDLAALLALGQTCVAAIEKGQDFIIALINTQPAEVRVALWQRHMVVTEPLYQLAAKVAGLLERQIGGATPVASTTPEVHP